MAAAQLSPKRQVTQDFAAHISSAKAAFFEAAGIDFVLGRREGPYLYDLDGGKRLIDCHCNGGVFNLGHRHPEIIQVLTRGLERLDIGNHHLISQPRAALARQLADLLPGRLDRVIFNVSGGEAVDLAIKIARGFTGRPEILSAVGGYHGHTGLALAAGDPQYRDPFGPQPAGFRQLPFNNSAAMEAAIGDQTAAVILETIPATNGIEMPQPGYLPRVQALCRSRGALFIADEIQTGLGRTGRLWGVEHFGIEPDILVSGKGLSGGIYPITATCFRPELEAIFQDNPFAHVSTFGGAEIGCLAAQKVLQISASPDFLANVSRMGALFTEAFRRLTEKHGGVLLGLRGLGLMMGVELAHPQLGPLFTRAAYEAGFLSVYANNNPAVAQLLPPLIIDQDLAQDILSRVDTALGMVARLAG